MSDPGRASVRLTAMQLMRQLVALWNSEWGSAGPRVRPQSTRKGPSELLRMFGSPESE